MLLELRISNLALIERADIQFGPGLNVLTGETGAGKSILIHALGLLTGERATSEQVGKSSDDGIGRARIEGSFDLSRSPHALAFLQEQDIAVDDNALLIVREVTSDGRSRVRINGQMATNATLRELGGLIVDLHGQHEHQRLLRPETHVQFLDEFGDETHLNLKVNVRTAWNKWQESRQRLDELTANEQQRAQRIDMLQFQVSEIDSASLQPGEDLSLTDERARLMNAEKLREAAGICRDALLGSDEPGVTTLLTQALKAGREIESYDQSAGEWVEVLQSALYELEDAAAQARDYADQLDGDPLRLEDIEARLHRLNRLKRKYGDSVEQILAYRAEVDEELISLNISEEELSGLQNEVEKNRKGYFILALKLSESRRALAARFSHEVVTHLRTLAMERARLEVGFEEIENGGAEGMDRIEFLFSANPGQPLRPLARIASGGEISRVMLALRSALFAPRSDEPASGVVPILVFDEVDTGIGGVTAEALGAKMRELARGFQVFCVTHLPQIARRADSHFSVLKESDEEETRVSVTNLRGTDRVHEIARMMGGESEATLRHAEELLHEAQNGKAGSGSGGAKASASQEKSNTAKNKRSAG